MKTTWKELEIPNSNHVECKSKLNQMYQITIDSIVLVTEIGQCVHNSSTVQ